MTLLASFLLLIYVAFIGLILSQIYKGNTAYILLYIICFLPFYSIFQVIVFNAFENPILVNSIKYSKDFVFYSSFILFLFFWLKISSFLLLFLVYFVFISLNFYICVDRITSTDGTMAWYAHSLYGDLLWQLKGKLNYCLVSLNIFLPKK